MSNTIPAVPSPDTGLDPLYPRWFTRPLDGKSVLLGLVHILRMDGPFGGALVFRDGKERKTTGTIEECREFVKKGVWVELTPAEAKAWAAGAQ